MGDNNMSDLEQLLEDLGRPKSVAPKKARASVVNLNELEALMTDLADAPAPPKVGNSKITIRAAPLAAAPVQTPPKPSPAARLSTATFEADDLDSIMNALNGDYGETSHHSRNSPPVAVENHYQAPPPPAPVVRVPSPDPIQTFPDLDFELEQLEQLDRLSAPPPVDAPAPAPAPPAPVAQPSRITSTNTIDELEELLNGLEDTSSSSLSLAPPAKPYNASNSRIYTAPAPVAAAPPPAASAPVPSYSAPKPVANNNSFIQRDNNYSAPRDSYAPAPSSNSFIQRDNNYSAPRDNYSSAPSSNSFIRDNIYSAPRDNFAPAPSSNSFIQRDNYQPGGGSRIHGAPPPNNYGNNNNYSAPANNNYQPGGGSRIHGAPPTSDYGNNNYQPGGGSRIHGAPPTSDYGNNNYSAPANNNYQPGGGSRIHGAPTNNYGNNNNNQYSAKPEQRQFAAKPPAVRPMPDTSLDMLLGDLQEQLRTAPDPNTPTSRGHCATCNKPILGEVITALGKIFHPEHFVCGNCMVPLGTSNFYEQDGLANCERCYQELLCPRCAHCDEPILDRCVTALGKKWHMDHFVCAQCLAPFPNGSFFERDSRPYCERCFSTAFAPRCAGCNQPIQGPCINALGQAWHPEHFVCQYCQKAFSGSFFDFGGKPYCDLHYHQQTGSVCGGCGKAVTGKCVDALGKKWHPDHFVCAFCMNPLAAGSFTENGNKAYCRDCHGKLFG